MPLLPPERAVFGKSRWVPREGRFDVFRLQESIPVVIQDVKSVIHQAGIEGVVDLEEAGGHEIRVAKVTFAVLICCLQKSLHCSLQSPAPRPPAVCLAGSLQVLQGDLSVIVAVRLCEGMTHHSHVQLSKIALGSNGIEATSVHLCRLRETIKAFQHLLSNWYRIGLMSHQPGVLQRLLGSRSILRVSCQHRAQEVPSLRTAPHALMPRRHAEDLVEILVEAFVFAKLLQDRLNRVPELLSLSKGSDACQQLECSDTHRPNVCSHGEAGLRNCQLWGQIRDCSGKLLHSALVGRC
mmetsp:Transcript_53406/g.116591  ORF Transcript_53406/g.116591 Transcript_53406/m.116591 type:complete len:295 (-) Transcript_53406:577-1461(-)